LLQAQKEREKQHRFTVCKKSPFSE
jgi:hypothetical protein